MVGPITQIENCYKSRTTTISTLVTILGIHSHSRQCKQMECIIILPTSRCINARQNINASHVKNPTNNLHLISRALHHILYICIVPTVLCALAFRSRSLAIAAAFVCVLVTSEPAVTEQTPSPNTPSSDELEIHEGVTRKPCCR